MGKSGNRASETRMPLPAASRARLRRLRICWVFLVLVMSLATARTCWFSMQAYRISKNCLPSLPSTVISSIVVCPFLQDSLIFTSICFPIRPGKASVTVLPTSFSGFVSIIKCFDIIVCCQENDYNNDEYFHNYPAKIPNAVPT